MNKLKEYLETDIKQYKFKMMPISDVIEAMSKEGWEYQDDYESKGWQVNFWITFEKGSKKIIFRGSLWYGQFTLDKE